MACSKTRAIRILNAAISSRAASKLLRRLTAPTIQGKKYVPKVQQCSKSIANPYNTGKPHSAKPNIIVLSVTLNKYDKIIRKHQGHKIIKIKASSAVSNFVKINKIQLYINFFKLKTVAIEELRVRAGILRGFNQIMLNKYRRVNNSISDQFQRKLAARTKLAGAAKEISFCKIQNKL